MGNLMTPAFCAGYDAGCEDPGFAIAKQPEEIKNIYDQGTVEHEDFEKGYRAAIH